MDEAAAKSAIVAAGRRLGARGLISAGEGNLSVRLDADRILVTPSGRRKDELEATDLVAVRIGHAERDARSATGLSPSSDLAIHLAVYAARPDIGAVVHAHLPASMALTLAGEIPDPAALSQGSDPLPGAALLERHGAVAVGPELTTAVDRLELVEVLCRTWADAVLLRAARAGRLRRRVRRSRRSGGT